MASVARLFFAAGYAAGASIAQSPTGMLEGQVTDASGGAVTQAVVEVRNSQVGFLRSSTSIENGLFRFAPLPVGRYTVSVSAPSFSRFEQEGVDILVSKVVRLQVELQVGAQSERITVDADAGLVDAATNTLGKAISGREILDLPLNGRNFTQLGLLQAGVAPISSGLLNQAGSMRAGQSYAVNGQRPESNNYLLDGATNVNRVDSGFALRIPVDAIAEFRILTHTAPPEYGGNLGSTTSVVTRSGSNQFHGTLYEFLRNDKLDARNFFSRSVEPLKQSQFGGTAGGAIRRDRLFFFGYYEGFRNRQGVTHSAPVPTAAQREGDFSGLSTPLLNLEAGGAPFPGGRIPRELFSPVASRVIELYPLGNVSSSVYSTTVVGSSTYDQAGGRVDLNRSERDQLFARYSYSSGSNMNPISVRGASLPGFPVRDHLTANSVTLADTHTLSSSLTNYFRASFFRYSFIFDERLNKNGPRTFGFDYDTTFLSGQGPPFFNLAGYSPTGGAITGPRETAQNTYEVHNSLSWFRQRHFLKLGGELRRLQVNVVQAIAPNAFFVFTPSFPSSDAFANLLMGRPSVFFQARGDTSRGIRNWGGSWYIQDEWRITRQFTINIGLRHEFINPNTEIRDRLNTFVPGAQSRVFPEAPAGALFPDDPGVSAGIAPGYRAGLMPRIGIAWDPSGRGRMSIRAGYGIFYDPFSNGANMTIHSATASVPWVQFYQISGPRVNFVQPYAETVIAKPNTFVPAASLVVLDNSARPPYAQDWNFSIQHALGANSTLEARYVGTKGTRLPRYMEGNPAVYTSGATAQDADRRRIYANCRPNGGPCDFATIARLIYGTNSTYHSGQLTFARRYAAGISTNVSYWYSKSLDYLSSMTLQGAAAKPQAGENDIAQNPFDLRAEHGPSIFDATHRVAASGTWDLPLARRAQGIQRKLLEGWQFNVIAVANTGTPFTVYDTRNVSLQPSHPPISGYFASRPNLIGDPHSGPRTVESWITRDPFQRLNPQTQAGQFGNAGRNIARGPGATTVDLSLAKSFLVSESVRLQFRAEAFNALNHANFGLPIADLQTADFGRILSAGPARLVQFGLKLVY